MTKLSKAFGGGSKYFKATDMDEFEGQSLTIDRLEEVVFGERGTDNGERKWVLFFEEDPKGLVMNKTNVNLLIEMHGDLDPIEYSGKRVELYRVMTEFQGRQMPGIRLRPATKTDNEELPF